MELDDEPSWAQALTSLEREFWIAGGHKELKSLKDLKVFVLVPRSEVPHSHRPLKGNVTLPLNVSLDVGFRRTIDLAMSVHGLPIVTRHSSHKVR